jgi:hypothetical protein
MASAPSTSPRSAPGSTAGLLISGRIDGPGRHQARPARSACRKLSCRRSAPPTGLRLTRLDPRVPCPRTGGQGRWSAATCSIWSPVPEATELHVRGGRATRAYPPPRRRVGHPRQCGHRSQRHDGQPWLEQRRHFPPTSSRVWP